jgi:hypothetical protein
VTGAGLSGVLAGVTGSEYDNSGETGKVKARGARGEAAAMVCASISKGVTGVSEARDGGGATGGNRAETGAGLFLEDIGVKTVVHVKGDGVVLRAETRLSTALLLAEEMPERY